MTYTLSNSIAKALLLPVALAASFAGAQQLIIANPLDLDRPQEVVELPLERVLHAVHLKADQAAKIAAVDAATGKILPSQLYSSHANAALDTFLLLVQLPAKGRKKVLLKAQDSAHDSAPLVFGRLVPERKDDFAWENQLVTYRIYGPALQATGEITSGIDVWSKRIPHFIIDDFYKRDAEGSRTHDPALSYHKDNGIGVDSYDVGPTQGCGGTAIYANGRLYPSKNYAHVRILAQGPIRFAFEATYEPWNADGVSVAETKRIILDAGSHLNRIESTYTWQGSQALEIAAGVTVHAGAETAAPLPNTIAAIWDTPQDPTTGHIATGLLALPEQHPTLLSQPAASRPGYDLLLFSRHSGESVTYYAGSGWSKADMPTFAAWTDYLKTQLHLSEARLTVDWRK